VKNVKPAEPGAVFPRYHRPLHMYVPNREAEFARVRELRQNEKKDEAAKAKRFGDWFMNKKFDAKPLDKSQRPLIITHEILAQHLGIFVFIFFYFEHAPYRETCVPDPSKKV
jgi:hypothetical protein